MSSCTLCTDRNLHRVCTSVACRVDRPCIHAAATRGSTLPPWSPASFPEPPSSAHTQDIPDIMTGCRQRRFLAEIVTGSHGSHATARICHRRRPSRRHPAAARYAHRFGVDYIRQCSVQADQLAELGRQDRPVITSPASIWTRSRMRRRMGLKGRLRTHNAPIS